MSWLLTAKVQKTKVGSPSGKALLLALANFADDKGGNCFPGQDALQEITELSLDTIQRQLKLLIEAGFISAEKTRRKGHWASWLYSIKVEKLDDQAAQCGTVNQAAQCGTESKDQAAPCGPTKPQDAAQPSRTMRLKPFSKPFKEPTRPRAPSRPDGLGERCTEVSESGWNDVLKAFAQYGRWTQHVTLYGPDPTSPACRAPRHLLVRHGLASEAAA